MCFSASRKGLEGLSLSSVRETVEEIRRPKYVYPSTISMVGNLNFGLLRIDN